MKRVAFVGVVAAIALTVLLTTQGGRNGRSDGRRNAQDLSGGQIPSGQIPSGQGATGPPATSEPEAREVGIEGGWTSMRGGPELRGFRQGDISRKPKLRWTFETNAGVESTAAVAGGRVYVNTTTGLVALELFPKKTDDNRAASGKLLWRFPSEAGMRSSPGLRDGRLFFGDDFGVFHAVRAADGKEVWTFDTETEAEIISSANFFADKVLFGSYDGHLYCLNREDGELAWKLRTDDQVHASPAVAEGQTFIAGCDEHLRSIELESGNELWSLPLGSNCAAAPVISGEKLFVGTFGAQVLALRWKDASRQARATAPAAGEPPAQEAVLEDPASKDFTPQEVALEAIPLEAIPLEDSAVPWAWKYEAAGKRRPFYASVAIGPLPAVEGRPQARQVVVAGGRDKAVHAIDAETGKRLWKFQTKGRVDASPVIVGRYVFAASLDGRLYLLELASGEKVWEFTADSRLYAAPAVGEGSLVISSSEGVVYCFDLKG